MSKQNQGNDQNIGNAGGTDNTRDTLNPSRLNILLVDIDIDTIEVAEYAFKSYYPANCKIVSEGQEALALLSSNPTPAFDIILIGRELPDIMGGELSVEIRKISNYASVPIIMQNSRCKYEIKEELERAEIDHYISKPYDIETLFPIIERLVKKSSG